MCVWRITQEKWIGYRALEHVENREPVLYNEIIKSLSEAHWKLYCITMNALE